MNDDALKAIREEIDAIDYQIHDLLNERAKCVLKVAEIKRDQDIPVHRPAREHEIYQRIEVYNQGPFDADAILTIFKTIIAESIKLQKTI